MSDTQQEQSAGDTTELDASQGAYQGEIPESASDYAKEVNALLNDEIDVSPEPESETEPESEVEEPTEEVEEVETQEQNEEVEETEEERKKSSDAARYRIKKNDVIGKTASALYKVNEGWTMDQAIEAAKELHPELVSTPESTTPETSPTEELNTVDKQITNLREKRKTAIREFDADAQIEIEDQIEALRDKKLELTVKQRESDITEEQRFYAEVERFTSQAVELYPDAAKAGSALAKEMARIDTELIATDNPLIFEPNKALRVAQMAANNLAIAPRSKSAAEPTVKRVSTRPAMQPASGQTRSTSASAPVLDAISKEDMSLAEYEALTESLRISLPSM